MEQRPADPGPCILTAFDRVDEAGKGGDLCQAAFDPVFQLRRDVEIIGEIRSAAG